MQKISSSASGWRLSVDLHNRQPVTWLRALLIVLPLAVTGICSNTVAADETVSDSSLSAYHLDTPDEYVFLEQQIHRGESSSAHAELTTIISQIESARHRYHEDLLVPLTLAGDAHLVRKEYRQALEHYDRARHIARVSTGLFDPGQLPIVYREASAYRRIGDLKSASQREEYAYEVAKKAFGNYSAQGLPALYRLAEFYIYINHYVAARSLYNRALAIHTVQHEENTPAAIPALQGIANSHRLTRFPPYYINTNSDAPAVAGPAPGLTTTDLDGQHLAFNDFPAGERALQQIIEIRETHQPDETESLISALLELADWHLMFDRSNTAQTLYRHVYDTYAQSGVTAARFNGPAQIYYPVPEDPQAPPANAPQEARNGYVTLGFEVSSTGRIRKLKTVESVPEGLMDFRVRRSMRQAIYRPGFVDGMPATMPEQRYTHRFTYYPKKGQAEAENSGSEPAADAGSGTNSDTGSDTGSDAGPDNGDAGSADSVPQITPATAAPPAQGAADTQVAEDAAQTRLNELEDSKTDADNSQQTEQHSRQSS